MTWVVAAVVFLVAAILCHGPILSAPSQLMIGLDPSHDWAPVDRTDQQMVLSTVIGNARRLLERPGDLRDEGQCYPLPRAYALGEHMFGEGLMAAPVLGLTKQPVLAYNSMLVLRLWIAAMTMFAFIRHVTGHTSAAIVAGMLYGMHHYRVTDPVHPFVPTEPWVRSLGVSTSD